MKYFNELKERERVQLIKTAYPKGTRIKLYSMKGELQMKEGLEGTVMFVDDIGQIHVKWENGSTLALQEHDSYSIIS